MSDRGPVHHEWLAKVQRDIDADYARLHRQAGGDPQRAGHGGEKTWAQFFRDWLPPSYEVVTRRYIIPEAGDDVFETDIVVFHPSYPASLRNREEVLASGVAAAFNARLTVDSEGIADAASRAARLSRGQKLRGGSPRTEMLGLFPVGLVAHSHAWVAPKSQPDDNVSTALQTAASKAMHPRELLDYTCVSDLGLWYTLRMPYEPDIGPAGHVVTVRALTAEVHLEVGFSRLAALLSRLYRRLSYRDASLVPLAEGFHLTDSEGGGSGPSRSWPLDQVFSEHVRSGLVSRRNPEWQLPLE